ncbi:hypothetical protein SLEP1_g31928 [Rubroshorea leprosula]|uniref:Leucine-rich repeat-containing N-terminal plant-type domain-containing protein n=1 Tax=Rubroshorea leprosula TaxID=152421 RepID=A0AAV5KBT0_9ROSI|nr:hypothetical protein SLEP1_g31928 [Rubroshorea leprosula]
MLLLAIIFLQINVGLAFGHCQSDQQELLLQLKNRLRFNPDVSLKLVKWNQSLDCCMWEGVTCDVRGRVIDLDLSNERIFDGIDKSSSLFNLQHLQSLNLANNSFSFIAPSQFDKLSNLRHLNLSNAGFYGQIPLEISRLTSLVTLDLSTNFHLELKLENPNLVMLVQNLKELRHLYLDGINISTPGKEWCQALSSLSNLKVLSMSNCHLSSSIDSSLSKLQSLSVIRLDGNNLFGPFPEKIFQVRTLKTLDLSGNPLLEGSLIEFLPTSSLETLLLNGTHFGGTLPKSIGNLGRLSRIDLAGCHFNGTIPEAMANLTQLVLLDFSSNNFSGPIPSFSLAKNLTHLNLAHNQLTGSILSIEWSSLSKLVIIDLRDNALNGTLPATLFGIPSLQSLVLSQNQFTGGLHEPPELASTALHSLELDNNMLVGPFPMNLSTLDLSFNSLSINATISDPVSVSQIQTLKLASCKLKRFPNFLEEQPKLSILDLSANQIDGEIPNWVWTSLSLDYLNLSHNSLVNSQGPCRLRVLLYYSSNNFNSTIQFYSSSSTISFILLSNNSLRGSIPESICGAANLQVLDLSNNYLNGSIPQCLNEMESLKVLGLSRNNLNGNISDKFSSNCLLQTLNLDGNHLEGKVPRSLANCAMLEVLDLGNNQINYTFPCHLKNMSNLRVLTWKAMMVASDELKVLVLEDNVRLDLDHSYGISKRCYGNHFTRKPGLCRDSEGCYGSTRNTQICRGSEGCYGSTRNAQIYKALHGYDALRSDVESGNNNFSQGIYYQYAASITIKGCETRLVKIISLLISIDFSCNKFEGQIPEVLGEFRALYALNLSHNGFTGLIPSSLGNLLHLESLDFSSNNLNGEIPQQLDNLNFLAVLNLSHNQLEGRIPSGRQLQTFSEDSFRDNKGLCGMPLKENCSLNVLPPSKDKHLDMEGILTGTS